MSTTAAPSNRSYHHGDLREGLLDAAEGLLGEGGLDGFTLRACARRAGVSHAAPTHHFGNVRGLLTALAARGFTRLVTGLREALADAGDDLDAQFLATSSAYTGFAEAWPEHFRVMFRSDLVDAQDADLCAAAHATWLELTNVILRQRGEAELVANEMPHALEREALLQDIVLGWCHVHGYAHLRLEGQLQMVSPEIMGRAQTAATSRLGAAIRRDAEGTAPEN